MSRTTSRAVLAALVTCSTVALAACGGHDKPKAAASPSPSLTSASPTAAPPPPPPTCPLTGKVPAKGMKRTRAPLAMKIDNVDVARPQSGIDHADVIFEETVEGGVTRLFAIFQCDTAANVGPVRSARTTDSALIQLLGRTVFGYSGANPRVNAKIHSTPGAIALSNDENSGLYHRSGPHAAPHNVYTSTHTILAAGLARTKKMKAPRPMFSYSDAPPAGRVVRSIALRWSDLASAGWTWTSKGWVRKQNGTPDVLSNGRRVKADNVVVMRIKTRYLGLRDVLGNASPDDVITGHGRVWVFRNGHVIAGHWSHPKLRAPLRLVAHGKVIPLTPGKTWVELLPRPGTVSFSKR